MVIAKGEPPEEPEPPGVGEPPYKVTDPNAIKHYLTKAALKNLERSYRFDRLISTNLSQVSFYLWTPEGSFYPPFA